MKATLKLISKRLAITAAAITLLAACETQHKPEVAESSQTVETSTVLSQQLDRNLVLPGEILPYQDVPIYPKVTGFIQWIGVDRGSIVKKGQVLVKLVAPEMGAQHSEAQQKELAAQAAVAESRRRLDQAVADKMEAEARLAADRLTYKRTVEAAQTPGVIAQNDLDILKQTVESDEQRVSAREAMVKSAKVQIKASEDVSKKSHDAVKDIADMQAYLTVTAPYDGVITERNMHEGSLAYPPSGANGYPPMLRIKENSLLRIVVPVPEVAAGDVSNGMPINFTVAAYPERTFTGKVARIAHSLEPKTRTMPVELNYENPGWKLSPGMFPQVVWPMHRNGPTLFVPDSAVVVSLEKPFVIKVENGIARRVEVVRGQTMAGLVEVFGDVHAGDRVITHASDEIENGAKIAVR